MFNDLPLPTPILIGDVEFTNCTSRWINASNAPGADLSTYFRPDADNISTSALFSLDAVESLLSSRRVATIKAKFCITTFKQNLEQFTIVLFGTDVNGAKTSAYHLGVPSQLDFLGAAQGGNIPDWLGKTWVQNWRDYLKNHETLPAETVFNTREGMLEGYNYDMMDVLNALYKGNAANRNEYLCIHFAIHKHYGPGKTDPNDLTYTFNLVLQRVLANVSDTAARSVVLSITTDNDVYYDISSPSPPY